MVWHTPELLPEALRQEAVDVAVEVCRRLGDPERVEAAVHAAGGQARHEGTARLFGPDLAQGWSGLALLFEHADRCRPDEGWDRQAQTALGRGADLAAGRADRLPAGLASGWAGIAFATTYLGRGGRRYGRWLSELLPHATRAAAATVARVAGRDGPRPFSDFDQISGLAGQFAGLLATGADEVLASLAAALVTGTLGPGASDRPLWPTAADQMWDAALRQRHPQGVVNLGLAHGVPGVVAALALAEAAGPVAPDGLGPDGLAEPPGRAALAAAADWLAQQVVWADGKPVLSHFLSLGQATRGEAPGRTAWCYGPPGAARALALAGTVLDRPDLADLGDALLLASLDQPLRVSYLISPTFCHGRAGVLQIAARMANARPASAVAARLPQLCRQVLEAWEPDSLLGFRNIESGGNPVDTPSLLDGAAGTALALLSVAHAPDPGWDRAFLLS